MKPTSNIAILQVCRACTPQELILTFSSRSRPQSCYFAGGIATATNRDPPCVEASAWKSVQVLAGSIVEALLVAEEFVRVLREEDGERVIEYGDAFFSASDLRWLAAAQREMVVAHLLNRIPNIQTEATLRLLDGILPFLENYRVVKWVDSFVRTVTNASRHTPRKSARDHFVGEVLGASPEVWEKVQERLEVWGTTYRENGSTERLTALEEMRDEAAGYFDPPVD